MRKVFKYFFLSIISLITLIVVFVPEDPAWIDCSDESDLYRYVYNGWKVDKVIKDYKIVKELLVVSKERYNRIKVLNEFGNASNLDLLSAEIDLNNDSINLMNVEFDLLDAKNQLNITLNRDLLYDFIVEDNKLKHNKFIPGVNILTSQPILISVLTMFFFAPRS